MSEQDQRRIFSKNLSRLLEKNDKTQKEVADAISVSPQTFNTWIKGVALPRMGKVQAIADYFHLPKSALIEEQEPDQDGYYIDPATARKAQELFEDPQLRVLFDAARDSRPEDLQKAADFLKAAKALSLGLDRDEGA